MPAAAQHTTTRISVTTGGAQGTAESSFPSISADGRYVAFQSDAALVPDDSNGLTDIYVHDRQSATTERINLGPSGVQATGGASTTPSISADGRYIAFASKATNLVSGDSNTRQDIFIRDRQTGTTTRASMAPSGAGGPGSVQSNGDSFDPEISGNGRHVAFRSVATNFVTDTNNAADTFVTNLDTRVVTRVSVTSAGAQATGGDSFVSVISADGGVVAFTSRATNLVAGDTNGTWDVFARDLQAGTTIRASISPTGAQFDESGLSPSISADGRFVGFTTFNPDLEPEGSGVFVHDRQSGVTSVITFDPNSAGLGESRISGNGRYVCLSQPSPLPQLYELALFDRQSQSRTRVSVATNGDTGDNEHWGCRPNVDGTVAAFVSLATNLVSGDSNDRSDVFVRSMPGNALPPPTMALEKTTLTFGGLTSGGSLVAQTAAQLVRLTQSGAGTVTWTAASNQPWLQVSPGSGTGSATLSIGVTNASGLPASGTIAAQITLTLTGSGNTVGPIAVSLTLRPDSTSLGPFGTVDTPTDHRTGVTGAVPVTGWALDDIEVRRVSICRAAFGAEVAPVDPNCAGAAEIFVGFGVFIDGARPDVAGTYPSAPMATRAGWGFMVLTNMLPAQGNGTYQFTMRAQDREGNWFLLGTRTMTCANASATLPFGTLDTPFQGGTASGNAYVNFGWALTPQPKIIPTDGSTIRVLVDGVDVGPADYNHARPDIQALFPGFRNTDGAVGFRILDTTAMSNGLHTISWTVTDNTGAIEGIGSRFFAVSNGVAAATASATTPPTATTVDRLPLDATPLAGRRGWDLAAPFESLSAGATGVTVIRSEEVNRVELQLGDGHYAGYLRTPAGLAPLPIGSRLEAASNTFTWAPGVGFIGPYDFVFVRSTNGRALSRRAVRIVLHPKGRGAIGPQVVIDVPRAHGAASQPFMIGGWAVDLDAAEGTGVTTMHAWAFPAAGGAPIFLGATAYGGSRPDVAAVHGDRFKNSGFGLIAQGLPAGEYDLALFAWSTETFGFVAPRIVRVHVVP